MGSDGLLPRTLVVELDGVVIGELYLHVTAGWAQVEVADRARDTEAEIGWALDPAHQGHGYATEAASELVRICFEDLGVRRIIATAFADNDPSLRVMERLGMRRETRGVRTTLHRERGWVDNIGVRAAGRRVARRRRCATGRARGDRATFDRITWPRRTARLSIRPATSDDLRAVFDIRTLPEVGQWMPERPTSYDAFVLRFGELGLLARTLVIELDGVVIGDLYLQVDDAWAQADTAARAGEEAEIGWCLSPAHQGHGYATEAAAELVRVCFEDLGVRRVTAAAFADNLPSLRIMERLGMRQESHGIRDSLHRDLGWVDGVVYALLADEWRAWRRLAGSPTGVGIPATAGLPSVSAWPRRERRARAVAGRLRSPRSPCPPRSPRGRRGRGPGRRRHR